MNSPWYAILMWVGIAGGAWLWGRRFRAQPQLVAVYLAAVVGALLGAKLGFVAAEWPFIRGDADRWRQVLHGKTILGALFGGYLGVEAGKKLMGYRRPTGDFFAVVVPLGLVLGRLGCVAHGCCPGVVCEASWWTATDAAGFSRWPTAWVELIFNASAAALLLVFSRWRIFRGRGQLFHVYLIAYAVFRIVHEPMRATARYGWGDAGGVSPYQVLAAALLIFSGWRFVRRHRGGAGG